MKCAVGHIYMITDENAYGAGNDVSRFIMSEEPLSNEEQTTLYNCLSKAKRNSVESDTDDRINEALEKYYDATGKTLMMADDVITGYISF